MSAADIAILYLGVAFLIACVFALVWFSRWALRREQARQDWHVAHPADVADQERLLFAAEIESEFEEESA